jgi:hemoglobin-like flavoprotein
MGITRHPLWLDPRAAQRWPVDEQLLARLGASLPRTPQEEAQLAQLFYGRLLDERPELRALFPEDLARQTAKLVASLRAVLAGVQRPIEVQALLEELGRSHAKLGATPELYVLVCERLAAALAELRSGEADVRRDWLDALQRVASVMNGAR